MAGFHPFYNGSIINSSSLRVKSLVTHDTYIIRIFSTFIDILTKLRDPFLLWDAPAKV